MKFNLKNEIFLIMCVCVCMSVSVCVCVMSKKSSDVISTTEKPFWVGSFALIDKIILELLTSILE